MTQQMINPGQYIAFVDKLNELEEAAKKINGRGLSVDLADSAEMFGFTHYSVEWDSHADRWTLVSETDDAPDLCSFNQAVPTECSETDLCEQCHAVQVALADEYDRVTG